MDAIEATEFGDSDVLETVERDRPDPGSGQVRIAVEAAGVNFADVMQRRGEYLGGPEPPFVPGMEAAGTIDAVGEGVEREVGERVEREVGERVVAMADTGYAEYVLADASALFDLPGGMSFEEAAGFPVQFLTAHNTLFEWGGLEAGEGVLIHAAAGGVGTAATQLAREAGATVFGTASTQDKRDLAAELGVDHPIDYTAGGFADDVNDATDQTGVDLVLDGVGGETTAESLECLSHFGRMVSYGAASGEPGKVDTTALLFANQRVLGYHLGRAIERDPERVFDAVVPLTELLAGGDIEVIVGKTFPLSEAAAAHRSIENRESTGKVVLKP